MTPLIWYVVISCAITSLISFYSAYQVRKILYISGSYIILLNAILSGLWDMTVSGIVFLSANAGNFTLNIPLIIAWVPVLYTFYRVLNVWRDLFFAGQVSDTWLRNLFSRKKRRLW